MADQKPITGNRQVDEDLSVLFAFVEDDNRLAMAKKAIADESTTLEQLQAAIPIGVLRLCVALLDREQTSALLGSILEEERREVLETAIALSSQHFGGVDRHPAILAELRRELTRRQTEARDDGENTINSVGWEAIWQQDGDKLVPAVRLRLRGEPEKLLVASTMDWDDLAFLIRALCRVLQRHMEVSKPVSEANLLLVVNSEKVGERLGDASEMLQQISELGQAFGIKVAPASEGDGPGD